MRIGTPPEVARTGPEAKCNDRSIVFHRPGLDLHQPGDARTGGEIGSQRPGGGLSHDGGSRAPSRRPAAARRSRSQRIRAAESCSPTGTAPGCKRGKFNRQLPRAIESLLDLTPATALVKRGETSEELAVSEVANPRPSGESSSRRRIGSPRYVSATMRKPTSLLE